MKTFVRYVLVLLPALIAQSAFAAEGATPEGMAWGAGLGGLGLGLAALGGALGQGKMAAAALEGIARNPAAQNRIFTPMILGLAFAESLVIFTWVIAFFLYGKL